jgi:hypothetical protein
MIQAGAAKKTPTPIAHPQRTPMTPSTSAVTARFEAGAPAGADGMRFAGGGVAVAAAAGLAARHPKVVQPPFSCQHSTWWGIPQTGQTIAGISPSIADWQ